MASLDSVRQKIYRAKEHWNELREEIIRYYESDPGDLFPADESTPENPLFVFKEKKPVPAKIALVLGDALQCLRSSLDYLVWELVEAAGNTPHRQLLFPIAMSEKQYREDLVKRHRLDGVVPEAIAIIDKLQPYLQPLPKETVLGILDELTNVNKHRRVIFTGLHATVDPLPPMFPRFSGVIMREGANGLIIEGTPMQAFLTLQEGLTKNIEVTNCVDTIAKLISQEIVPLFECFFK
jgi:hypothetical protein